MERAPARARPPAAPRARAAPSPGTFAPHVLRMCAPCAGGHDARARCEACGAGSNAIAHAAPALRHASSALPHSDRIQASFGRHDLSHVRTAIGGPARAASDRLSAAAFTSGDRIAFRDAPDLRLAAHESAHVVQQRGGAGLQTFRRDVSSPGDGWERHADRVAGAVVDGRSAEPLLDEVAARGAADRPRVQLQSLPAPAPEIHECISPAAARELSDEDLDARVAGLRRMRAEGGEASADALWIDEELRVLQSIQLERRTGLEVLANDIPRPVGLPEDGAFALQPAGDLPAELVASIPEGRVVQIALPAPAPAVAPMALVASASSPMASEDESAPPLSLVGGPVAGASRAMTSSIDAALIRTGLQAAGPDAIGIVGIPRLGSPGARIPESFAHLLDSWGHSAIYVRQGGEVTIVRGFNPILQQLVGNTSAVRSGAGGVAAEISADAYLFTMTSARSIEYPVSPALAAELAGTLPPTGPIAPGGALPHQYTAMPAVENLPCQSNCGLYAVETAEAALGGRIGPSSSGVPITELSSTGEAVPRTASQGRLMRFFSQVEQGAEAAMPVPNATGAAVAGRMSTGLQVLKWGGRVMFVVGLATVPLEIILAPPGLRLRTGVGAGAGFAGGLAAGAAAGLVCGPGAPVCSVVLGLGFGIAGALGARASAEALFDAIAALWNNPEYIPIGLFGPAHTLTAAGGYRRMLRNPYDLQREWAEQARAAELARLRARLVGP